MKWQRWVLAAVPQVRSGPLHRRRGQGRHGPARQGPFRAKLEFPWQVKAAGGEQDLLSKLWRAALITGISRNFPMVGISSTLRGGLLLIPRISRLRVC